MKPRNETEGQSPPAHRQPKDRNASDARVNLRDPRHRRLWRHLDTLARPATGHFDHPVRQPARPDSNAPRQPDQVHRRELRPRPLVTVVVKRFQPLGRERLVQALASRIRRRIALLIDEGTWKVTIITNRPLTAEESAAVSAIQRGGGLSTVGLGGSLDDA